MHNTKCINDFYNVYITHYHQRPLLLTEFCPTSKNCGPRLENMDLYSRLLVLNKNCRPVDRCKKIQSTYILGTLSQKKTILFGNFSQHGGGGLPKSQNFCKFEKQCLFGSKTVFFGQEVHYYMVYIAYFIFHISYFILHISYFFG